MTQATPRDSTPRTDSSAFRRLSEREVSPKDVLTDLFVEELHPDPEWMADRVIERLADAGYIIWPTEAPKPPKAP
jgi:SOS response regulatory protein OraA/RecX